VADALSTGFMIQPAEEIADLSRTYPGLEAWLVPAPEEEGQKAPVLVHLGASGT
jgi:thiamine biosynthesis lipoprotein ApbE